MAQVDKYRQLERARNDYSIRYVAVLQYPDGRVEEWEYLSFNEAIMRADAHVWKDRERNRAWICVRKEAA